MEDGDPGVIVSPNQEGGFSFSIEVEQPEHVPSEQEIAEMRRIEERTLTVQSFFEEIAPSRPIEYYYRSVSERFKVAIEDFDREKRGTAVKEFNTERYNKRYVSDQIAKLGLADSELLDYTRLVYQTSQTLGRGGEVFSFSRILSLIYSAENLDQARFIQTLSVNWKDRFLSESLDDRTYGRRSANFTSLLHGLIIPDMDAQDLSDPILMQRYEAYSDVYGYVYSLPENEQTSMVTGRFITRAMDVGKNFKDPEQVRRLLFLFQEMEDYPNKFTKDQFMEITSRYAIHHGLDDDALIGFRAYLLPALEMEDYQLAILQKGGNIWGMRVGEFGIADLLTHCYKLRLSPDQINQAIMVLRSVPGTSLEALEQNRLDGGTLAPVFGIMRDFIHDQRLYVHDVVSAMVRFYETGDTETLKNVVAKTDYLAEGGETWSLFDRKKYEELTPARVSGGYSEQTVMVTPIDVLKRLEINTIPIPDMPPVTTDSELNRLMNNLIRSKTGEITFGSIPRREIGQAFDYLNTGLELGMLEGRIGIEPNHLMAIAWLDRIGFQVLKRLTFEEQQTAYREDWFISLLRFQQLTASTSYDEKEFDQFMTQLKACPTYKEASVLIQQHVLVELDALARGYKADGREDVGFLWNGNVAHELIGLTDPKSAQSEFGRKQAIQDVRRKTEKGWHPGD